MIRAFSFIGTGVYGYGYRPSLVRLVRVTELNLNTYGFVDVLTNYKSIKCTKERYLLSMSVRSAKKANQEKASELTCSILEVITLKQNLPHCLFLTIPSEDHALVYWPEEDCVSILNPVLLS